MEYDVVIVGAGPAGSSAAREAAKRGISVLVLEEHPEIGLPIQCGEGLTACEMERAGLSPNSSWVLHRSPGSALVVPDGRKIISSEPVYSIDRAAFDRHFAEMAKRDGAIFKTDHRVISIKAGNGKWEIRVRTGNTEFSVFSKLIIGADGPVSIVGRTFGAYKRRKTVVGVGYNVSHAEIDDMYHFFFSSVWPGGYAWIFPRGDSYNIGVATSSRNPISLLREFAGEHGIRIDGRFTSGVIPAGFEMNFYSMVKDGAGLMLAGDSAGLTHPITYGGIYPALMSGRMAGRTAAEGIVSGNMSSTLKYDRMLRRGDFYVRNPDRVNRAIYSFSDDDFNLLADIADGRSLREINQPLAAMRLLFGGNLKVLRKISRIRGALFDALC